MELPVEIVSAESVRALIARAAPEAEPASSDLGSVTLHPHQISAVLRIYTAIDEFGGVLLADEVGMGKTFVALAVARMFHRSIVVAPAVLRDMWSQQGRLANAPLPFTSFESLSRGHRPDTAFDLIVIDEAHHLRNPRTRRFHEVSRMAMRARVLLLSATPVHNRRNDLTTLLSIFLGSRAESLSALDISRCVVRRQIESAGLAGCIPDTGALVWKELEDDDRMPAALLSLPPPVPPRGGGDGGVLVVRSLFRQWCSSDGALESALRRRLARSAALISALESGHYPSEGELSAWAIADDSVQLAFPSLVATPFAEPATLLDSIRLHRDALEAVLRSLGAGHPRDAERARLLRQIRLAHSEVPVVAFSQYAETVNALFRELRQESGVAVLTARGARVAGGSITRRDAIARFAPRASGVRPAREAERIGLLLTTDLLSEGVNLQDAGVVVHLDLPWTPARLEQRMGRVARMGSAHGRVYAYGIRPAASAEKLIRIEATIRAKMGEAAASIGGFRPLLPDKSGPLTVARYPLPVEESTPRGSSALSPVTANLITANAITAAEHIRLLLRRWSEDLISMDEPGLSLDSGRTLVAGVSSQRSGFLALCALGSRFVLLASDEARVTDDPSAVLDLLLDAEGRAGRPRAERIRRSLSLLESHLRARRTMELADEEKAAVASARRAALRRVSVILERARPHMRSRLLKLGEDARNVLLGRLGRAAESEIIHLASMEIPDDEWLTVVAGYASIDVGSPHAAGPGAEVAHARIVALLLLELSESDPAQSRLVNAVTVAKER